MSQSVTLVMLEMLVEMILFFSALIQFLYFKEVYIDIFVIVLVVWAVLEIFALSFWNCFSRQS